ncbi:nuclease-related domain-containing protein [Actinomycetospora sp. TBRC 11914]|uniref:nuclease-related domain-containing protein n=1 Tax=Actinomycetospora sp. TBRC 11914 TaxID=2729387 RepID=UPI00145F2D66|nr:nuclease-related domain-containing protein [Actinomycetospora sp. TBRC 11914]NMO93949.1 NERD domain-containing protein [Actinomycetospora sp. TBRC 11914]
MPARRTRLGRGDRVVVTSPYGSRLGTYDLQTGEVSDVAPTFRATFVAELDEWLVAHGMERFPGFSDDVGVRRPSRRQRLTDTLRIPRQGGARTQDRAPSTAGAGAGGARRRDPAGALEPGPATPADGWSADSADGFRADAFVDAGRPTHDDVAETDDWEDLAFHGPDHGLLREASRARATGNRERDRELRLRADGRHAVADALARESGGNGRGPRWRMLHGVETAVGPETVTLDHLVIGTPGVFVVEVRHQPGGKVHASTTGIEIDGKQFDLARIRTIGEEVHERLAEGIALAAGFEEVLDPPPVTPVIAVVGGTIVTHSRPRGVIVARAGDLARAMRSRGERLSAAAVEETYAVARRSDTWLP